MTDIEQKALALLNEVLAERVHWKMTGTRAENASLEALCRAIEQHEAFRQEVLHRAREPRVGALGLEEVRGPVRQPSGSGVRRRSDPGVRRRSFLVGRRSLSASCARNHPSASQQLPCCSARFLD